MTDEQKAADAAKAEADAQAAADKEKADADFEAEIADLPEEEQTAKRTERDAQNPDKDKEIDEEIQKEKEIAAKAFQTREAKRKADEAAAAAGGDDKPLTKKDLADIEARAVARANAGRAMEIAKTLATSPKEAELIFLKWQGRQFPEGLSIEQQLEEAYAITNAKKLIGERNEAVRALKNKGNVTVDSSTTYRPGPSASGPKMKPNDLTAITGAGYVLNNTSKKYEKKLPNGATLELDPVSKQTRMIPKA